MDVDETSSACHAFNKLWNSLQNTKNFNEMEIYNLNEKMRLINIKCIRERVKSQYR